MEATPRRGQLDSTASEIGSEDTLRRSPAEETRLLTVWFLRYDPVFDPLTTTDLNLS